MEFHQNGYDASQRGGVTSAAKREQGRDLRRSWFGADDAFRFQRVLDLPDDPTAMTLEQLEHLIAYNDALTKRWDDALQRVHGVRDQFEAALRKYGGELVRHLRRSEGAALRANWSEAFAEYNACRSEADAIGAYVDRLEDNPPL